MRVKITESVLKDAGFHLSEGDTITVEDSLGQYWCDHGWAEDADGVYPTGERKVQINEPINPKKAVHAARSSEA